MKQWMLVFAFCLALPLPSAAKLNLQFGAGGAYVYDADKFSGKSSVFRPAFQLGVFKPNSPDTAIGTSLEFVPNFGGDLLATWRVVDFGKQVSDKSALSAYIGIPYINSSPREYGVAAGGGYIWQLSSALALSAEISYGSVDSSSIIWATTMLKYRF
ncbi:hypothetical protein [Aliagarivorans marinus]|uniref:hypothetical protein n=1 Tax=Aliagarivorans marinus TaxID=561965 RepID=UPI0012F7F8CF|nr:hypothetical protein [Aliagarivorans marinus]